jgi:hypothetical protein
MLRFDTEIEFVGARKESYQSDSETYCRKRHTTRRSRPSQSTRSLFRLM